MDLPFTAFVSSSTVMGTEMHCKSFIPGFLDYSNTSSRPLFCGDKMLANGQCYNGFAPKTSVDAHPGHYKEKDTLKQKMLEHEAVFKNQVLELHRLYRIQRDMMEEFKMKEPHTDRASTEAASSSSPHRPPMPSEEARKCHVSGANSNHGRTSVVGIEKFSSPTSCTKRDADTSPAGQLPLQNGSTIKNSEASDSRPLKVRKKLFDLQLPADEYIDPEEEENMRGYKRDVSSHSLNGDPTNGPDSGTEFFLGSHVGAKTDRLNDAAPASAVCLRGSIGLADLNEPIRIEETVPPSIDFLVHTSENGENKTTNQHAKSTASYLSAAGEPLHLRDGVSISSYTQTQVNDRGWLSHVNVAGSSRGNLCSVIQGCQLDKSPLSSHPRQGTTNQVHYPPGMYSSGYNKEEKWREGFRHGLESSNRCYSHSNDNHFEPIGSRTPGSYPFFTSSSFTSSWFHSVSSWARPSSSFPQKIATLETPGDPVVAMSRPLQPSAPCRQSFGGNWHFDSSSKLNRGSGSEPKSNGFYHPPSSGAKELLLESLSAGFDRGDSVATNHGFANLPKGLYHAGSKPAIDINLNEALPKSLANENDMADPKSKPEHNFSTLPWLKPKPVHVDEVTDTMRSELLRDSSYRPASPNGMFSKNGTVSDLNQLYPSNLMLTSLYSQIPREQEIDQTTTVKKILGFPIFKRDVTENKLRSLTSTSVNVDCCSEGRVIAIDESENGIIDINVKCEPEQISVEEPTVEKGNREKVKDQFDLNSCVCESEDPSPTHYDQSASVKVPLEIDLEAPILMESEDDDSTESKENSMNEVSSQSFDELNKEIHDEVFKDAAETLVAISSCPQVDTEDSVRLPFGASLEEALLWLADAIYPNEVGNKSRVTEGSLLLNSSQEIDDFEATTLQLVETKAEHYMPKPLLPELQNFEEAGARPLQTRNRRGQARRGRQWRDFQRDILPGLASLSRHEMTEDLQIFGGLMRATGHSWNSGLTRRNGTRNGGARGRRRAVVEVVPPVIASSACTPLIQQLSRIEAGLEDRSLTGWGKTTRRPRRQRCPAGNPPVVLT